MSQQQTLHTPGKICFKENGEANSYQLLSENGVWLMSILHNGEAITDRQRANLSRMAVCWNCFDGVPSEEIPASIGEPKSESLKYHVMYTSSMGPKLESFKTDEERQQWCSEQDDSFESFFAIDGIVDQVYNPIIGE